MKKSKVFPFLVFIFCLINFNLIFSQINIDNYPVRSQYTSQYTDIYISSPKNNTIIQDVHDDSDQIIYANSDHFYYFDQSLGSYILLPQDESVTVMQPGVGYVLQIGGNGNYNQGVTEYRIQDFSGGNDNNGDIYTPVTANSYCLLGNPYNNFLDLDSFLLHPNNVGKVKGPVYLWTHNTIASTANINPNDTNPYRFSANDFAMYNVLGGCAAGRSISTSADTGINTGIQTPNGRLCFGTGFGITGINTGNVIFTNDMRSNNNNGETQSFKTNEVSSTTAPALVTPPTRHRIWVNIEKGVPPTSGLNVNPLKQLLVGYAECYGSDCSTAADNDRVFDAETVTLNSQPKIEFYSLAVGSTKHLAIQGRDATTFTPNDYFQLGYKVVTTGEYTFTASADGIFDATTGTQDYFIKDMSFSPPQIHTFPYTANITDTSNSSRFRVVFNSCQSSLSQMNSQISTNLVPGATSYIWSVTNLQTNQTLPPFSTNLRVFNLSGPYIPAGFATYNTSYSYYAIAVVGGVQQPASPICIVTTPSPTTQVNASICNTTIISNIPIPISNSGNVLGNNYNVHMTWSGGSVDFTVPNNSPAINLLNIPNFTPAYNTTYSIQIQIQNPNGQPLPYGNICTITTSTPSTQLDSTLCNTTISNIPIPISNSGNFLGNNYNVHMTWSSGSVDFTVPYNSPTINLLNIPNFTPAYNTTYSIQIQIQNPNGQPLPYGNICTVTTSTPSTQLDSTLCNTTISNFGPIGINSSVNYFYENYNVHMTWSGGSIDFTVPYSPGNVYLSNIPNFTPLYNTTYSIQIQIQNPNGGLLPFGTICTITTPSPTTQLSNCGGYTLDSISSFVYAAIVNTPGYSWSVTNTSLPLGPNNPHTFTTVLRQFAFDDNLNWPANFVTSNTQYCISVRPLNLDQQDNLSYGNSCCVTTPNFGPRFSGSIINFDVSLSPNPFDDDFSVSMISNSEELVKVRVYDMLGKLIETLDVNYSEIEKLRFGNDYSSGIYNVLIQQGEYQYASRIIKK